MFTKRSTIIIIITKTIMAAGNTNILSAIKSVSESDPATLAKDVLLGKKDTEPKAVRSFIYDFMKVHNEFEAAGRMLINDDLITTAFLDRRAWQALVVDR